MKHQVPIIGCGLTGLIAAKVIQQQGQSPIIFEKQKKLPNNHKTLLRFRSSRIGEITGIPFRPVRMLKYALPYRNPVTDAIEYSRKCTGVGRSDRSLPVGVVAGDRFIAPSNFIERIAAGVEIKLGQEVEFEKRNSRSVPILSTMPMDILADELVYDGGELRFERVKGTHIEATATDMDAFVSVYVPDPKHLVSRISCTGNLVHIELPNPRNEKRDGAATEQALTLACNVLGVRQLNDVKTYESKYAKIASIDNRERKRFIAFATDNYAVYSIGRFATWRPEMMLDDVPEDAISICKMMDGGSYTLNRMRRSA